MTESLQKIYERHKVGDRYTKDETRPPVGMGYIYALLYPNTNDIAYIGKTKQSLRNRLCGHISVAKSKIDSGRNSPLSKWLRYLIAEDTKPEMAVLACVNIEQLNEYEIKHIEIGRTKYHLLNVDDGGPLGRKPGCKMPKEFSERQSLQRSGLNASNFVDLTGKKFNWLTVIKLAGFGNNGSRWLCKCDCGNEKIVDRVNLRKTISCGCSKKKH